MPALCTVVCLPTNFMFPLLQEILCLKQCLGESNENLSSKREEGKNGETIIKNCTCTVHGTRFDLLAQFVLIRCVLEVPT